MESLPPEKQCNSIEDEGKYGGEAEAVYIRSLTTHQHTLHIANTRWRSQTPYNLTQNVTDGTRSPR